MTHLPRIELNQRRGAWLAGNASEAGRDALGAFDAIPVMPGDAAGAWRWDRAPGFVAQPPDSGPPWWMRPEHARWREMLLLGAPIWLRGAGERSGVYAIDDVVLDATEFSFRIVERLAEAGE